MLGKGHMAVEIEALRDKLEQELLQHRVLGCFA